ncbi:stromal cell-derived factor 1-like, partial [Erythrolamprus reginae]|uniref:stromal cell-derived factor 1-like n=1 Tax=Erythrolamprus reginae TaxID=121349 RepID=UPI00396C60D9
KPISLTYRCPCRYFESHVSKSHIKHMKILTVPGCPLQLIARLKNSSKQICVDSKLKWIQEYLEKYYQKKEIKAWNFDGRRKKRRRTVAAKGRRRIKM